MTPYYSDEWVTIYHADALEWSGSADVLVTDPPYGVAFDGKTTKWSKGPVGYTRPDDPLIGPRVVARLLANVQRAAVFTGNRNLHSYPPPRDIGGVYCPSGAGRSPWGFSCFNPVLFYGVRSGDPRPTSISSFALADSVDHPCPKPFTWMTWLVSLASRPGETVLDPFAGSGTTLAAAKLLGRRSIGIEIEERYCEVAARRCSQEVLGLLA